MPSGAMAQYKPPIQHFPTVNVTAQPLTGQEPVTFQADTVNYDKEHGLVSADGHVEAWQNDHVLRADRVTFDRNTNVAAAYGHVVIVEPDGQVLFADYAELTQGMRNGVLTGMRALLDQNGRLAANGARRTEGRVNEMSRGVYSTCNVCMQHPEQAPLWQIRARLLTDDLENKRLEYRDATLDFLGFPVLYLPYFSNADPSVKRQSGFLIPSIGATDTHLGSFAIIPYYWVLDDHSDLLLTPTLATKTGPQLEATYRRDFNNGVVRLDGAIANDQKSIQGYVFAHALFNYNDTWRYGADINLASSTAYLRDFRVPGYGTNVLASTAFVEGFGVGSYARLDIREYQGLDATINQSLLPYVLPRFEYSFLGEPDLLGGRLAFDTQEFNILRDQGTNDQQFGATLNWNRPLAGPMGQLWLATLQAAGVAYNANVLNAQPNYQSDDVGRGFRGQVQAALRLNWPFIRPAGKSGNQIVEPILQVIAAPQSSASSHRNAPNEDSLDYEFTDATLFDLNRFHGYDRYDGGVRVNAGLRAQWNFSGGQRLEGLVGASWQQHIDQNLYPQFQPWNGFERDRRLSDIVTRIGYTPNLLYTFAARGRFDHDNGDVRFADIIASAGPPVLRVDAGFVYSPVNPYTLYLPISFDGVPIGGFNFPNALNPRYHLLPAFFTPREEATAGLYAHFGAYTLHADARRDLHTGQLISTAADGKWENECFAFDVYAARRYTSIAGDRGDTTVLFTIILKTVGAFGVNG